MKKAYLAQLERFGHYLTAVGKTKGEAHDAVMTAYKKAFKDSNDGVDPAKDFFPGSDQTYLQVAEDEIFVTSINLGEVIWL